MRLRRSPNNAALNILDARCAWVVLCIAFCISVVGKRDWIEIVAAKEDVEAMI